MEEVRRGPTSSTLGI